MTCRRPPEYLYRASAETPIGQLYGTARSEDDARKMLEEQMRSFEVAAHIHIDKYKLETEDGSKNA